MERLDSEDLLAIVGGLIALPIIAAAPYIIWLNIISAGSIV